MNGSMIWEGLRMVCGAVLAMGVKASVVILIVLFARALLKKMPKVFSYVLWSVVLFRLLCPISVTSEYSVFNLFEVGAMAEVTDRIQNMADELIDSDTGQEHGADALGNPDVEIMPDTETDAKTDVKQNGSNGEQLGRIACGIWLSGVAALVVYSAVSLIRLKRKLSDGMYMKDNIYLSDHIATAFVIGVISPRIYLPSGLSEKEQEYILLHEQHHIRRGDHVVKLLVFVALCLHWYNPLVWLAFVLTGKDMEMSCDEAVIRKLGPEVRADYSASLLSLATGYRIIAGTPLAFGEGDTEGRIKNLARWKKPALWISVIGAILCVALIVILFTNPKRYISQIRINGIDYVLQEETVRKLPESSFEMGTLEGTLHRTTEEPEKDFYGVNLDEKYPGNLIYQQAGVTDVIYLQDHGGYYLVFKSEQESPFHRTWDMEDIVFNFNSSYAYPKDLAPRYSLHKNGDLYLIYGDVGVCEGTFEAYELSEKKFDGFFDWSSDKGVWSKGKNLAAELRKDNAHAWKLDITYPRSGGDQPFYYLLLQNNGDVYLVHGYYDPQGPNDSAADDTFIDWMIKLGDPKY